MNTAQLAKDNLEIVLDWIDAMRVGDPDRFAGRLGSEVVWWDVSGRPACRGRDEVLEWLRTSAAVARERAVQALELIATSEHAVLGVRDPERTLLPLRIQTLRRRPTRRPCPRQSRRRRPPRRTPSLPDRPGQTVRGRCSPASRSPRHTGAATGHPEGTPSHSRCRHRRFPSAFGSGRRRPRSWC